MMSFVSRQSVRFAHVDPAGIVFYPRYFEMLNAAMEDYFGQIVGVDFREMHFDRGLGVPTVKLETDFVAPSRLGDELEFHFEVRKVGRSSVDIAIAVRCQGETRFNVQVVLVCMDLASKKSTPWPADMRPQKMSQAA